MPIIPPSGKQKFAGYELNIATREVIGPEGKVDLGGRNLDVLIFLILNRERMVSSREIYEQVWKLTWNPTCANNVDRALSTIRKAFNDSSETPIILDREKGRGVRFIAVIESTDQARPRVRRILAISLAAITLVTFLLVVARNRFAPQIVEVAGIRRVTHNDSLKRVPVVSDGVWAYFTEESSGRYAITRLRLQDGYSDHVETTIPNPYVAAISPSKHELLVRQITGDFSNHECPLWIQPLPGGSPVSLEPYGIKGFDGVWTPAGNHLVVCHGAEILEFDFATKQKRVLTKIKGFSWWPRWSPDGRKLRFTVQSEASDDSLWELRMDTGDSHALFSSLMLPWAHGGCGTWSPDGSQFFFDAPPDRGGNPRDKALWIWDEKRNQLPRLLTSQVGRVRGPSFPGNGDEVWIRGESPGAEPIALKLGTDGGERRFMAPHHFETASFSKNGTWIAYTSDSPEEELWVSRLDGTARRRLIAQPWQCAFPDWSPDGKQIVLMTKTLGETWQLTIVQVETGETKRVDWNGRNVFHPTWHPDGKWITVGTIPALENNSKNRHLANMEVSTNKITDLPDTDDLYRPTVSPDGKWIVSLHFPSDTLSVYEIRTGKVRPLVETAVYAPVWRTDSRGVIFVDKKPDGVIAVNEASIPDGRLTSNLLQLRGITLLDRWIGLSPDNELILIRSLVRQQLFAVKLRKP